MLDDDAVRGLVPEGTTRPKESRLGGPTWIGPGVLRQGSHLSLS